MLQNKTELESSVGSFFRRTEALCGVIFGVCIWHRSSVLCWIRLLNVQRCPTTRVESKEDFCGTWLLDLLKFSDRQPVALAFHVKRLTDDDDACWRLQKLRGNVLYLRSVLVYLSSIELSRIVCVFSSAHHSYPLVKLVKHNDANFLEKAVMFAVSDWDRSATLVFISVRREETLLGLFIYLWVNLFRFHSIPLIGCTVYCYQCTDTNVFVLSLINSFHQLWLFKKKQHCQQNKQTRSPS